MESSARDYARLWKKSERDFVSGLAAPDRASRLRAIVRAAGYFRIARSFRLAFDVGRGVERLGPVLDVIDDYRKPTLTDTALVAVVSAVRHRLAEAYGKNDLLSAATKFLWLAHQHPVVIYDSQVRAALGAPTGDYSAYLELWRARYDEAAPRIQAAVTALRKSADLPSDTEWFHRRVLDIHLWKQGAT